MTCEKRKLCWEERGKTGFPVFPMRGQQFLQAGANRSADQRKLQIFNL